MDSFQTANCVLPFFTTCRLQLSFQSVQRVSVRGLPEETPTCDMGGAAPPMSGTLEAGGNLLLEDCRYKVPLSQGPQNNRRFWCLVLSRGTGEDEGAPGQMKVPLPPFLHGI